MAGIQVLRNAILLCRQARVTPFLWGHRGLGKSSLVRQLAAAHHWGFVDLRCSQLEAADLRGLPERTRDGRTRFLPSTDLPGGALPGGAIENPLRAATPGERKRLQPRYPRGVLFLDELNRAPDDVLQAAFQLVLDGAVGEYMLPDGWSVVAAGNFTEGYQVNGFQDPAFLDRFCHLVLDAGATTVDEWVAWMSDEHGAAAADVIEFTTSNLEHLDGTAEGGLGFTVQPSRRSWDAVVRVQRAAEALGAESPVILEVVAGLVGRELAVSLQRYRCPVRPRDLIAAGVERMRARLAKLSRNQLVGLLWGVVSVATDRLDDRLGAVVVVFAAGLAAH